MGEWSKKIGELGEAIIGEFLYLIGWNNSQDGLTIDCLKKEKHQRNSGSCRRTHGIDYLFTYPSQLLDRTLDNLVISVKATSDPYPNNPSTKFKEYIVDLATTLECFKHSEVRKNNNRHFSAVDESRDIGVLFWISWRCIIET